MRNDILVPLKQLLHMYRQISVYKGVIIKLKKKIAILERNQQRVDAEMGDHWY